jgi:hypothetical protein
MEGLQAERPMALPVAAGPLTTPFGTLSWSQTLELALPGAVIGIIGGAIAGGLAAMGGLSILLVLAAGLGLAVPLALAGGAYDLLLAKGKLPLGTLAPAALLWVILFPPIRVVHAALLDLAGGGKVAVPHGWAAFVIYQVLVAVPFAIGFWWLHENFAPRWWFHIRKRNPVAEHWIRVQLDYAEAAELEKQRRSERQAAKRAKRR